MSSSTASLIGAFFFPALSLSFGIPALLELCVATPAQIQDGIAASPGVSDRLKFAVGPISIGELHTMQGGCKRQATLATQKRAAEVPSAPK